VSALALQAVQVRAISAATQVELAEKPSARSPVSQEAALAQLLTTLW
jgi:hypothetical protein